MFTVPRGCPGSGLPLLEVVRARSSSASSLSVSVTIKILRFPGPLPSQHRPCRFPPADADPVVDSICFRDIDASYAPPCCTCNTSWAHVLAGWRCWPGTVSCWPTPLPRRRQSLELLALPSTCLCLCPDGPLGLTPPCRSSHCVATPPTICRLRPHGGRKCPSCLSTCCFSAGLVPSPFAGYRLHHVRVVCAMVCHQVQEGHARGHCRSWRLLRPSERAALVGPRSRGCRRCARPCVPHATQSRVSAAPVSVQGVAGLHEVPARTSSTLRSPAADAPAVVLPLRAGQPARRRSPAVSALLNKDLNSPHPVSICARSALSASSVSHPVSAVACPPVLHPVPTAIGLQHQLGLGAVREVYHHLPSPVSRHMRRIDAATAARPPCR